MALSRCRRLSAGENTNPIPLLRDMDQPFIFEINLSAKQYRLELYDTSSPENWRLLEPDVVIICYDISQRMTLINMKRYVRFLPSTFPGQFQVCPMLMINPVDRRDQKVLPARRLHPRTHHGPEEGPPIR